MFRRFLSLHLTLLQFVVPSMALQVVDRAIQAYGAEGVSQDQVLASTWAGLRTLRLADVSLYHLDVSASDQRIDLIGARCCM